MREPLTSALLAEELKRLMAVFPSKIGAQNPAFTAEVYKDGLRGIDGDALKAAVDVCIQSDNFFPKVARLREAANEWTRRNRSTFAPTIHAAWNVCGVCGARAEALDVTRPLLHYDDAGKPYYLAQAGVRVAQRDLFDAQTRGVLFVMETVPSQRTTMNHSPDMHHVRGESYEEGAA